MPAHRRAASYVDKILRGAGRRTCRRSGTLLASTGDRYGMRRIDVSGQASRVVVSAPKAYQTVAITDDATAFAAVTSAASEGRLSYAVEVWRIATATRLTRD
jgi:hypothetical protein